MGIETRSLAKRYGAAVVVQGASFDCPTGQITGLLGPNGSGKTTTMRLMTGLARADAGTTTFDGIEFAKLPTPGQTVGVLLDPSAHHSGRSVIETVRLAALLAEVKRDRVAELLNLMGLENVANRRFSALSLGMQQRVGLAIAFLGRPRFLILDEPMNGLDVESIHWLRNMLVQFAHRDGGTVLISSHQLQELQSFVDRVVLVSQGRVVAEESMVTLTGVAKCEVSAVDLAALELALDQRAISYESADSGKLAVEADGTTIGRIAIEESIVLTALVPGGSQMLEGFYMQNTTGDFSTKAGVLK